jgi:hypothetical protein
MRKVYAVAWVLAMALGVPGCQQHRPTLAYTYTRGMAPPAMIKLTEGGRWALYLEGGMTPIHGPVQLQPGDEIGFRPDARGKIVGYAAGQEIELGNWLASSYTWKKEKAGK